MKTIITFITLFIVSCNATIYTNDITVDTKVIILREMRKKTHNIDYRIFDLKLVEKKDKVYGGDFVDIYGDKYDVISEIDNNRMVTASWIRVHHYDTVKLNSGQKFSEGVEVVK